MRSDKLCICLAKQMPGFANEHVLEKGMWFGRGYGGGGGRRRKSIVVSGTLQTQQMADGGNQSIQDVVPHDP